MPLRAQIEQRITADLKGNFRIKETWQVPTVQNLGLGKHGRTIETAILYADMRKSSNIAEDHRRQTAAKVYKTFLSSMARVARSVGGEIRSYDGDRIMVVFPPIRNSPKVACNKAVRTAMRMAWCLQEIVEPKLRGYDVVDCGIGIAFGRLLVVRAGIGGQPHNNDLIWVGRPANLAAQLSEKGGRPEHIWIDEETYNRLDDSYKYVLPGGAPGGSYRQDIWNTRMITFADQRMRVFSSQYREAFN